MSLWKSLEMGHRINQLGSLADLANMHMVFELGPNIFLG